MELDAAEFHAKVVAIIDNIFMRSSSLAARYMLP